MMQGKRKKAVVAAGIVLGLSIIGCLVIQDLKGSLRTKEEELNGTESESQEEDSPGIQESGEENLMTEEIKNMWEEESEKILYVPEKEKVSPVADEFLAQDTGSYVVAYYPSWAQYDKEGLKADEIDAVKLTHIHYAFAETTSYYAPFAKDIADHEENLRKLAGLRQKNPNLKLVLSVGGADGDKYFAKMCTSEKNLQIFTEGCLKFLREYDFDGIDLDWEFPNTASETKGFTDMVLCLRYYMDKLGKETGKHYSLSLAGAAESGVLHGINYAEVEPFLDYVFIMGYNLYGPWNETAGFNAPMYAPGELEAENKGKPTQNAYSLNSIVKTYLNSKIPAKKLVLGLPFYGYVLPVVSAGGAGLGQVIDQKRNVDTYMDCRSIFGRYLDVPGYEVGWDETARSPYLSGEGVFISYEDERSITAKCGLIEKYELAGAGFWELSQDTQDFKLSAAMYEAMTKFRTEK